jgi:hypothetical protein
MKANVPKSFLNLPKKEKAAITKLVNDEISERLDKEEAELQKIWIQLACIILNESFGFGKSRLMVFIGNWKRAYKRNNKLGSKKKQDEFLKEKMDKIFGEDQYPYDWIDSLEGES